MIILPAQNRLRAYVTSIIAAGALAGLAAAVLGGGPTNISLLLALVLAGAVSERFKVSLFGDCHVSSSAFLAMMAGLIGGPADAVIVASALGLSSNLGGVLPLYKSLFNVAVYVLSSLAFLCAFDVMTANAAFSNDTHRIVPATIAALVDFGVNSLLVAIAIGLATEQSPIRIIRRQHLWLTPHYLPLGALLVAAVVGYGAGGAVIVAVLAAPVAGIQIATFVYSSMRRAFESHIREVEVRIEAVQAELARMQGASVDHDLSRPAA